MNRSQANRAVVARRAAPSTPNVGVSTLWVEPSKGAIGRVRKVKAGKMTPLMRGGDDRQSAWARPTSLPYPISVVTCDVRWSA